MTDATVWINLAVFAASLGGFICLALASERQGEFLLHRMPTRRERLGFRLLGWPLLAVALAACLAGWGWSIGAVAWLGWLTVAGAALTFYLPWWPWQQKKVARARPAAAAQSSRQKGGEGERADGMAAAGSAVNTWSVPGLLPAKRTLAYASLLLMAPLVFLTAVWHEDATPILRPDAVHGLVGPWTFVIAETDRKPPVISDSGVPTKTFQIRFCEACDADIRAAYFKVRKPRSLRAAGLSFNGSRWTRFVEIAIPPASRLRDQLWLTVEGKDGKVYHHAFDFAQLSPATAAFIQENNP